MRQLLRNDRSRTVIELTIVMLILATILPCFPQLLQGSVVKSNAKGMIGARIHKDGSISCVRYRSPAQLAGLEVDDKIIMVNYQQFSLGIVKGVPGENIHLTVVRGTNNILFFDIKFVDSHDIDYKTDPTMFYEERKIVERADA